jgi:hypothetical protein
MGMDVEGNEEEDKFPRCSIMRLFDQIISSRRTEAGEGHLISMRVARGP